MSKCMLRRVYSAERVEETLEEGEIVYDMDEKRLYYGDGSTAGGIPLAKEREGE